MPILAASASPIFFIIAAVVMFVIFSSKRHNMAVTEAWQSAGRRLGLRYSQSGKKRKLEGTYRDFSVRINTFTQSSGNNNQTYTRFRVNYPDLGLGLELKHQHFFATLGRALTGGKDIIVGDKDFDDTVIVEGHAANQVIAFLTPDRRRQIMRLIAGERRALVRDSEASFVLKGASSDAQKMQRSLDVLIELATSFTNEAAEVPAPQPAPTAIPVPVPVPAAETDEELTSLEASLEAKFGLPAGSMTPEPISSPVEVSAEPPASPWAPAPTAPEAAAPIQEPAASEPWQSPSPIEPAAPVLADGTGAPEASEAPGATLPTGTTPEVELPEPIEAPAASGAVDYEALRSDLFETQRMSHEVKDHFEATYAGQTVQWSGKLERLSDYNSDMIFEGGQGTRAMVTLAPIQDGSFTKDVHAIVQLTRDQAADAKALTGQEVRITGQLLSCDSFMRNVFLSGGSLTA